MLWFTSDLHFGHDNIIKYCHRPFANAVEMNRTIINNINERVGCNDDLFILGDFVVSKGQPKELALEMFNAINCPHKHLVKGNHDRSRDIKNLSWEKYYTEPVEFWEYWNRDSLEYETFPIHLVLSHKPFRDKLEKSNGRHEEDMLDRNVRYNHYLSLHGHIHNYQAKTGRLSIDVGVDAWNYCPVSINQIMKLYQQNDDQENRISAVPTFF